MRSSRMLVAPVLASAVLLGGCGNSATNTYNEVVGEAPPEGLRTGVETEVRLRPELAGSPVGATISGSLVSADATWVVLDDAGERRWIRLDGVIWIGQPSPPPGEAEGQAGSTASDAETAPQPG